jgi:hypothetical protein
MHVHSCDQNAFRFGHYQLIQTRKIRGPSPAFSICERGGALLIDPATPYFFLEELGPHLHLFALDVAIYVVLAKDAAALIFLKCSMAHCKRRAERGRVDGDVDVAYYSPPMGEA